MDLVRDDPYLIAFTFLGHSDLGDFCSILACPPFGAVLSKQVFHTERASRFRSTRIYQSRYGVFPHQVTVPDQFSLVKVWLVPGDKLNGLIIVGKTGP